MGYPYVTMSSPDFALTCLNTKIYDEYDMPEAVSSTDN